MKRYIVVLCSACGHTVSEPVYFPDAFREHAPVIVRVTCEQCDHEFSVAVTRLAGKKLPKDKPQTL